MKKFLDERTLSPAAAEELLAQTPTYRLERVSEDRVRHFTRKLNQRAWNQWSGIIVLDENGGIVDGVNRIEAIARGYFDVPVLVSLTNRDPERPGAHAGGCRVSRQFSISASFSGNRK